MQCDELMVMMIMCFSYVKVQGGSISRSQIILDYESSVKYGCMV
jgi:hypothetical protein